MAPLWPVVVTPALVRCSPCGARIEPGELVARHVAVPEAVAHPACVGIAPEVTPVRAPGKRRRPLHRRVW